MDKIKIYNLEVYANHGVFPEETALGQKFLISATLYTDLRSAGKEDDLTKSIHYGEVCTLITAYMKNHTFKLIESVTEHLAEELLLTYNGLKKVVLEVKKPWAPIGLPLETVSIEIERQWHTAYVALGSNMGDKNRYLKEAVEKLKKDRHCRVAQVSDFICTKPYGYLEQEEFLNGCVELLTLYSPFELLDKLHELEREAERVREIHWGPRTLDLDLIFYDEEIISSENLCVPHVDMHNRGFVLEPLKQIAPYWRHPVFGKTVEQLAEQLKSM